MARIKELDRLSVIDEHLAHWALANDVEDPILLILGYGRQHLFGQRQQYHTLQETIAQLEADLIAAMAQRDAIFGIGPEDSAGAWFRVKQFKALMIARLGPRHVLSRTVPNLGRVGAQLYPDILGRFIDHWTRVNAALGAAPLTLGTFTLANLETMRDNLAAKITEIDSINATLRVRRQEREQLFGDETEEFREETSIIARLFLYHATIEAMFPGQPLADSLPEIFPAGIPSTPLPTFRFNWLVLPNGDLKVWYEPSDPELDDAAVLFLKEGAMELTSPVTSTTPGSVQVHTFQDVTVVDDLDELELRDTDSLTIARGTRDTSLPQPA